MSPESPQHATPVTTSEVARRTARYLTSRYVMAIAAVVVLAVAGQVLVQLALSRQALDARAINLAGRQRQFSQALCKALISTLQVPAPETAAAWSEIRDILPRWGKVHAALIHGDPELELRSEASPSLAARWAELDPAYQDLARQVNTALSNHQLDPTTISGLLIAQRRYLDLMEAVVSQLDHEAHDRVTQVRWLEAWFFAALGVVLCSEVIFIFRPVVRRIRDEISARERIEATIVEREVAEVSGRLERRIGQDLHDGLGQVLTGISFQLKALERRVAARSAVAGDAEMIADITRQVTQAISQTRSLARLLHPVEADADGLGAALQELGASNEKIFAVTITVTWPDDLPVPSTRIEMGDTPPSMHLYRIVQEALSNAIRHGQAKRVWITGAFTPCGDALPGFHAFSDLVELTIADDGRGFLPPGPDAIHGPASGMGLRIMAFRAECLGAQFSITPRVGGGMCVRVRWPTTGTVLTRSGNESS